MRWTIPVLIFCLASCDQKPKTAIELKAEYDAKYEAKLAEKLKAAEGKDFFVEIDNSPTDALAAHSRQDCPEHLNRLKDKLGIGRKFTVCPVGVRNGRFVDSKNFFYNVRFCSTCNP